MKGINVICISDDSNKIGAVIDEFIGQGVPFNFYTVEPNYSKPTHHGIKLAHQAAIEKAYEIGFESCVIVEDDVKFTSKRSLETFLEVKDTILDWGISISILVGGYHNCRIAGNFDGLPASYVDSCFSGMHCYSVLNDSVSFAECPPNMHVDNWVCENHHIATCDPMVAIQSPGYSKHKQMEVDYTPLFERFPILKD